MLRSRSLPFGASILAALALAAPAMAETPETPTAPPPAAPGAPPPVAPPPPSYPQPPSAQQPFAPPGAQPSQPSYPQAPQGYPQQAYPQQPGYPQQAYPQPPPAYPAGYGPAPQVYGQPGYPQQGYPPGYGYVPEGPPPPPPPVPTTLRWSLRFDPFELVMRRLTFQGEVYVAGPFAIEIAPSWIFGSPYEGIDKKGVAIAANAVFYLSGMGLRGMWLKAHFEYENYSATLSSQFDPTVATTPQRFASAILGAMIGDTFVIPKSGGFALSAGIGVGVATAGKTVLTLAADPVRNLPTEQTTLYDGFDKVRLLGTLGLGVAF